MRAPRKVGMASECKFVVWWPRETHTHNDSTLSDSTVIHATVSDSTFSDSLVSDTTLSDLLVSDSTLSDSLVSDSTLNEEVGVKYCNTQKFPTRDRLRTAGI